MGLRKEKSCFSVTFNFILNKNFFYFRFALFLLFLFIFSFGREEPNAIS